MNWIVNSRFKKDGKTFTITGVWRQGKDIVSYQFKTGDWDTGVQHFEMSAENFLSKVKKNDFVGI